MQSVLSDREIGVYGHDKDRRMTSIRIDPNVQYAVVLAVLIAIVILS